MIGIESISVKEDLTNIVKMGILYGRGIISQQIFQIIGEPAKCWSVLVFTCDPGLLKAKIGPMLFVLMPL